VAPKNNRRNSKQQLSVHERQPFLELRQLGHELRGGLGGLVCVHFLVMMIQIPFGFFAYMASQVFAFQQQMALGLILVDEFAAAGTRKHF